MKFKDWYTSLDIEEQKSVMVVVDLLEQEGPALPYPHSSAIVGVKRFDLRELRIQHQGRPYRVLYGFDPRRSAVLLLGGDKTGNNRWYEQNVPRAEKLYAQYLADLRKEGLIG